MAVFSQTISTSDGSDNWGYYNTGNSSWLSAANVFIGDVGGTDVTCGARFVVTVPAGATGISATLTFGGATSGGTPPYGTIYADDVDNSGALNSTHNGSVGSTNTTASVAMPDFSSSTVADVSGPVSEVLARGGWASGNNLALYATDVGSATDYEYFSSATLEITYTEPAAGGSGTFNPAVDGDDIGMYEDAGFWTSIGSFPDWYCGDPFGDVHSGMRFNSTGIPQGATIVSATLDIAGVTNNGTSPYFTIYGINQDAPAAFSLSNDPVNELAADRSTATATATSSNYTSIDVSSIVQEVVNRAGFNGTIQLTMISLGNGYLYNSSAAMSSYDLNVEWTEPAAGGGTGEVTETLDDATLSSTATISGHVGDVNVSLDAVTLSSTATITQPSFSVEHVYNPAAASNPGTSWSETGVDLSSVETGDIVVVALSVEDAGAFAVSSMSVSGVVTLAAEATADQGAGFRNTSTIWSGVATGSGSASESLDIAVNLSPDIVGVDVFVLKGFDATTVWSDTQIGTSVTSRSLTQSYSGDAVSIFAASSGNAGTFTWTGATETSDKQAGTASFSTAYINTPSAQTTVTDTASASMNRATLAGVAWALTADEGVNGSVTSTLDDATLASTATLAISGAVTATLDDATLVSAGELPITATVTATLDAATLVATGEEPLGGVEGSVTTTLDDATLSATGVLLVSGAVSATLDDATLVSAAALDIAAVSTTTLEDATLVATGTLALSGVVTATLEPATLDATGALAIVGSVATTLDDASLVSNGVSIQITVGSVTATLDDAVLSSTAEITQPEADASIPLGGGGYWDKDEEDRKKRASKEKLRDIINEAVDKLAEKPTVEVIDGEEEPTEIADVKVPEQLFSWVEREADTQGLYAVEADIQAMIEQMMLESAARLNDQRLTRLDEEEAILALLLVA